MDDPASEEILSSARNRFPILFTPEASSMGVSLEYLYKMYNEDKEGLTSILKVQDTVIKNMEILNSSPKRSLSEMMQGYILEYISTTNDVTLNINLDIDIHIDRFKSLIPMILRQHPPHIFPTGYMSWDGITTQEIDQYVSLHGPITVMKLVYNDELLFMLCNIDIMVSIIDKRRTPPLDNISYVIEYIRRLILDASFLIEYQNLLMMFIIAILGVNIDPNRDIEKVYNILRLHINRLNTLDYYTIKI